MQSDCVYERPFEGRRRSERTCSARSSVPSRARARARSYVVSPASLRVCRQTLPHGAWFETESCTTERTQSAEVHDSVRRSRPRASAVRQSPEGPLPRAFAHFVHRLHAHAWPDCLVESCGYVDFIHFAPHDSTSNRCAPSGRAACEIGRAHRQNRAPSGSSIDVAVAIRHLARRREDLASTMTDRA